MTSKSAAYTMRAIRTGVFAGLGVCLLYPALIFVPMPTPLTAALAAAWGPLLAVASIGLGRLLNLERESYATDLAVRFNIIAGALVGAMLLVQIAVGETMKGAATPREVAAVWLGLDVAWDAYIGTGTLLLGWAMRNHPRFGKALGWAGVALAAALLVLNLYTFPTPPGEAGLIDLGPFVGLWYLVVTIQAWRSLSWARARLAESR
jgi:hypothetical protein